ncbi:MAG: WbuC family cupin fold metalloprotein [Gammaproteobacteria bacterium]|nr:WbuC family cupin fold metalloprotein [Gammaproteobacteria bacterium]
MKIKQETSDVYYLAGPDIFLEKNDLNQLATLAFNSKRQRARYCAHENKESGTHEMFEVFTNQTYIRPLKQEQKIYSFHVIQGSVDIYLFSEKGELTDKISLGDFQSGKPFYFRAPINTYRTLVTTSEFLLYNEVTAGPFKKEDTIFAPWAPLEDDVEGIAQLRARLHAHKTSCQ